MTLRRANNYILRKCFPPPFVICHFRIWLNMDIYEYGYAMFTNKEISDISDRLIKCSWPVMILILSFFVEMIHRF